VWGQPQFIYRAYAQYKKGHADEKYTLDKIFQGHVLGRETRDTDTHEAGTSDGGRDLAQYF
jgi:hypothetical protein